MPSNIAFINIAAFSLDLGLVFFFGTAAAYPPTFFVSEPTDWNEAICPTDAPVGTD